MGPTNTFLSKSTRNTTASISINNNNGDTVHGEKLSGRSLANHGRVFAESDNYYRDDSISRGFENETRGAAPGSVRRGTQNIRRKLRPRDSGKSAETTERYQLAFRRAHSIEQSESSGARRAEFESGGNRGFEKIGG